MINQKKIIKKKTIEYLNNWLPVKKTNFMIQISKFLSLRKSFSYL